MLSSVLLILLQVCGLQLAVVAMPTCKLQGDLVTPAIPLLRDLGGGFPDHCLRFNANITFPDSAFPAAKTSQCPQALWVVHESLWQSSQIFDNHSAPVGEDGLTWDSEKLDRFRHLQYQLLEEGQCLSGVDGSGVLSSYFSNVSAVLQQPSGAACGWMALQRDLLRVLMSALQKHRTCFSWKDKHGAH